MVDIQELIDTLEKAKILLDLPLDTYIKDDVTARRVWEIISNLVIELEALKEG
tara:strand:+ start:372 stop:530 length:159 start_codon:yes stop_codon:yes gene_type:complete